MSCTSNHFPGDIHIYATVDSNELRLQMQQVSRYVIMPYNNIYYGLEDIY